MAGGPVEVAVVPGLARGGAAETIQKHLAPAKARLRARPRASPQYAFCSNFCAFSTLDDDPQTISRALEETDYLSH